MAMFVVLAMVLLLLAYPLSNRLLSFGYVATSLRALAWFLLHHPLPFLACQYDTRLSVGPTQVQSTP